MERGRPVCEFKTTYRSSAFRIECFPLDSLATDSVCWEESDAVTASSQSNETAAITAEHRANDMLEERQHRTFDMIVDGGNCPIN